MEKAKLRRDYERLQFEMEELSKQEQELRLKTNVRIEFLNEKKLN